MHLTMQFVVVTFTLMFDIAHVMTVLRCTMYLFDDFSGKNQIYRAGLAIGDRI